MKIQKIFSCFHVFAVFAVLFSCFLVLGFLVFYVCRILAGRDFLVWGKMSFSFEAVMKKLKKDKKMGAAGAVPGWGGKKNKQIDFLVFAKNATWPQV